MKAAGIITEYNPLHAGHLYHINETKKITDADCIVCIMSGNYVQRGEPAIFDKYTRTKTALKAGVNLVVELPVRYSTASSEGFSYGATSILNQMHVKQLVFGSECGDINLLKKIATILANEPKNFAEYLSEYLTSGQSYPLARMNALEDCIPNNGISDILSKPNNILATEYIKSIIQNNFYIEPLTIKRSANNYNDTTLTDIPSASAIRSTLKEQNLDKEYVCHNLAKFLDVSDFFPITIEDFSKLINFKLGELIYKRENLTDYLDINTIISNKLYKYFSYENSIETLINHCKTKDLTYLRIQRSLIHILLNITSEPLPTPGYIRILGFDNIGQKYISHIRNNICVPLVTKPANAKRFLTPEALHYFEQDIYSTNLYNSIKASKFNIPLENDYIKGPVRL